MKENKTPVLREIAFELNTRELMVVIGKAGAGKTSLLLSIMEETQKLAGEQDVRGRVALVEQDPFIFKGSIK